MESFHIWLENEKVKQLKLSNIIPELVTNEDLIGFSEPIVEFPTNGSIRISFRIEKIKNREINYYKLEVNFFNNKLHGV